MEIGNANYEGFKKKNYFKLKDGENVFRILPPLGNLAKSGRWSQFYEVHYGYTNSSGKLRLFQSPLIKNRQTRMVESPDAALDRIVQLKAMLEDAKKKGDHVSVERLGKLVGNGPKARAQYNLDKNHHMNVIDRDGNIGVLKIRHKAKLALDALIKKLREDGIDPLSVDNGRFFVFRRSGTGMETTFSVEVLKEKIKVEGVGVVERDIVHVLDENIIKRLSKEAFELDKLYKRPTSEEVARIVKEGSSAVDEIFDTKKASEESSEDDMDQEESEYVETSAPVQLSSSTTQAPLAVTLAPSSTQAPSLASKPAPAVTKVETKTTATTIAEMSEEEFRKSLGL